MSIHAMPTDAPSSRLGWCVLILLLVSNVPLFLCMPLTNDTALYDVQAANLLRGGVLYRDILEPNLPGVVWIHAGVRSLLGDRSEVMRLVDLAFFGGSVWLLSRWAGRLGYSAGCQIWTATVLCLFYLSVSEWNHCQRDLWMLFPALAGLHLRWRQVSRLKDETHSGRAVAGWAMLEGLCWGLAVWVKPHVILPAIACWLVSAACIRRPRRIAIDLAALITSGAMIGAVGIGWMLASGAWPYFLETVREWNPQYYTAGKEHWTVLRFLSMTYRFFPWLFLVPVSAAIAVWILLCGCRDDNAELLLQTHRQGRALLAAFFLGWLAQSFFLQHLFDYVHAPGVLLAITLAVVSPFPAHRRFGKPALIASLAIALLASPVMRSQRLGCWWTCVTRGTSPATQDRLKLLLLPNWEDMDRVAAFLRDRHVGQGELNCYNDNLVHLYAELGLRPATRFAYFSELLIYFPNRIDEFRQALAASPQRYVVVDLVACGLSPKEAMAAGPDGPSAPPPGLAAKNPKAYPWRHEFVFRSGPYLVYRVNPAPDKAAAPVRAQVLAD